MYEHFLEYLIPAVGSLIRGAFPFARYPDLRWSVVDTFDGVTPHYQSTHRSYEVYRWFLDAGLERVEPSDWGVTSYRGYRASGNV